MYPLSHRVEVGSTVQLHVLLSPGGGRLECGGEGGRGGGKGRGAWRESVEGRGRKEEGRGECVGRIDG